MPPLTNFHKPIHVTFLHAPQMLMVLVAGLMPEELQDDSAAGQLREVQLSLLHTLAQAHPEALLYSNFFRWGRAGRHVVCG